eukprot:CAMPEP_0119018148 /NCGR_PEP_ID=MMETSP1176-20130426/18713_1 /TAXON_ID=265551 /ORGANISM="Synedropsis recta cf, Strain CCMP1620" /LENGTH=159 /DNA_ID=CAMNT_0006972089 /DNA_START=76 /DNA_END=555 /DNA_ORIENTATION=-
MNPNESPASQSGHQQIQVTTSDSSKSDQISSLIQRAHSEYEDNPTEALSALMEALKLNSGQASADHAMGRLRDELGDDIADHVSSRHLRMQRAYRVVQELMNDESTMLHQRGQQDILRQAMEDGSSVVCTKCQEIISATRWQQHQQYWCTAIIDDDDES